MPKISVITPSYNKPGYINDAVESVKNQTFTDWEYLIVDNSSQIIDFLLMTHDDRITTVFKTFDTAFRTAFYPPAYILNSYLDKLNGEIILYLSDDDYFDPQCFARVATFFDENPEAMVCYFGMQSRKGSHAKGWQDNGVMHARMHWQKGNVLDCVIDGGAVAFRKEVLRKLAKPYFVTDWDNAGHCDGLFLTKLCEQFDFYPIDEVLLTKRVTEVSTHNRYESSFPDSR